MSMEVRNVDYGAFGSRLCQLRKMKGITQKTLAQKLCVQITTIKVLCQELGRRESGQQHLKSML